MIFLFLFIYIYAVWPIQLFSGGCSYEAVVVKVNHVPCLKPVKVDSDVALALDVLHSPALYNEYLSQLGVVAVSLRG